MTSSEQTSLKAALNNLASSFQPSANVQNYIRSWLSDVDALFDGQENLVTDLSNYGQAGLLTTTFANLPTAVASGYEAIITDASAPTYGATVSAGGGATRALLKWNGSNWICE